ncbi:hypothetical protein PMAYCL1PPCAC_06235 [Pristionchus mayeri]|uniref:RRM domain-containing protein n=1 Tax=Pristionchus mayeri TaxID=1317129 RepID=A0AAN4ZE88_9BILA|nr:hypothetical protein PMAYCL1PPCAC_06235 [Pristionchus mayeri]
MGDHEVVETERTRTRPPRLFHTARLESSPQNINPEHSRNLHQEDVMARLEAGWQALVTFPFLMSEYQVRTSPINKREYMKGTIVIAMSDSEDMQRKSFEYISSRQFYAGSLMYMDNGGSYVVHAQFQNMMAAEALMHYGGNLRNNEGKILGTVMYPPIPSGDPALCGSTLFVGGVPPCLFYRNEAKILFSELFNCDVELSVNHWKCRFASVESAISCALKIHGKPVGMSTLETKYSP